MKTVVIGFSTRRGILSYLIRLLTGSKISHTYVKKQSPIGTDVVFQASGIGVNFDSYVNFINKSKVIEELSVYVSDERYQDGEELLWTELGKPYATKQLFGYAWILLWKALGKKVENPFADHSHAYVCVEIVARYLGIADAESMTPQDLYDLLICPEKPF